MRWLVWVLLLGNVLLLGYFNLSEAPSAINQINHRPLEAEKITLLSAAEIQALPKKVVEAIEPAAAITPDAAQNSCYEWGSFSSVSLSRAMRALNKFSVSATVKQQSSQDAIRYWVYIPPLKSTQAAEAEMQELNSLGIEDRFIIQEQQWRNAISLGVFKDEELAKKLLQDLKSKGVTMATEGVHNQGKGQASLEINNISSDIAAQIEKLKPDFPSSELKQTDCQKE